MLKPTGRLGAPRCAGPSATGLRFTTLLTWRLLPAGKSRLPHWIGSSAPPPPAMEFSCLGREMGGLLDHRTTLGRAAPMNARKSLSPSTPPIFPSPALTHHPF